MTDEEKQLYMKYCKYDKEPKEVIIDLINLIEKQQAEIEKKDRQIELKDRYCDLIWCLGVDYDGWNTVESLKSLIDNLIDYAKRAIKNDDQYATYERGDGKYFNILDEEVQKPEEDK